MKTLEEKKLYVKMARAFGQPVDSAILESIEKEEKLAALLSQETLAKIISEKVTPKSQQVITEAQPTVTVPAAQPESEKPAYTPAPVDQQLIPPKKDIVQQTMNALSTAAPKVVSTLERKEIEGIKRTLSEMMQKIGTLSWGGGGTGIVKIWDADDLDRANAADGLYVQYNEERKQFTFAAGGGGGGAQGAQGRQGFQGAQGVQGTAGIQGAQGVQGSTGAQGVQGATGSGSQGVQGAPGPQGAIGVQGVQGAQGRQGIEGVQGAAGVQGVQGAQGQQGLGGVQGAAGPQGDQGAQGYQGLTGAQGDAGVQGAQGEQGIDGAQGAQGRQGYQGRDGNFGGASFDYTFSSSTANTDPGTGFLRFDNNDLTLSTRLYIDNLDDNTTNCYPFLVTIDDSTSAIKGHFRITNKFDSNDFAIFTIASLKVHINYLEVNSSYVSGSSTSFTNNDDLLVTFARTGDRGDAGAQGDQGTQGIQGAQGYQGLSGAQGDMGAQGEQGFQGVQGEQGYQGVQGVQGAQGFQGEQGFQGVQGEQGYQGVQGSAGTGFVNTLLITNSVYTIQTTDYYVGVNSSSSVTITLPDPSTNGRILIIKDESGNCSNNNITLSGPIDNDNTAIMAIDNMTLQLLYRSGWRIV